jgi:hypothetical protein
MIHELAAGEDSGMPNVEKITALVRTFGTPAA